MIAKVIEERHQFINDFNAKKWDELGALYEEGAVALPPNHEPLEGRAAIVEYYKSIRDAVGEGHCAEPFKTAVSGKLVAAVGRDCSAYSGQMGFTTHELFERQDDGSMLFKFDMFGMR
jgi:ketosteroid isomerase-like protein